MNAQQIRELEKQFIDLAVQHNCKYVTGLTTSEDAPCFTFMKCNVPLLADVRMLCEQWGIEHLIESSDSWGYIGIELD